MLETDDMKLPQRLQTAKAAIDTRLHELQMDHGGTPEERQAIADALGGLKVRRRELPIRSHETGVLATPERNLRFVRRERAVTVGMCEACTEQFRSYIHPRSQSEWEIKTLFERHKCRTLAERTVRDLTEQIRGESDPKKLGELVIAINLLLNVIEEQVAKHTGQQPPLRH